MRTPLRLALVCAVLAAATACGGVSANNPDANETPTIDAAPPEIDAAITGSCANPVTGTPPLGLEEVANGLDRPVYVTSPPGDPRLFIVEQVGTIRIVQGGNLLGTPFLDVSGDVSGGNEQGLLGLAFAPDYATSGKFYINYTDNAGDTNVEEVHVSADPNIADDASRTRILYVTQPYSNHNGGNLQFSPNDGYLYIGLGDGGAGDDPVGNGQNLGTMLGKMLRIDVSTIPYTVPADNPFLTMVGAEPEIWAYGLRNPWRYSFDRETGDLYIGDVGQNQWEEVNVQDSTSPGGVNYGWDTVEGNMHCHEPGTGCVQTGLTNPVYEYSHGDGCSITGGYVYRGACMPDYHGTYFVADYCNGWVRTFTWDGAGGITNLTDQPGLSGGNPSSFGQDANGELYVIRHSSSGSVHRVVPQ